MVISFCFICAENYIFTHKETNNSKHFKRKTKVFSIKTKTNETPYPNYSPKRKTIPAFFLALALVFSLSTGALAAGTTTATVPVTLTVSNEYRAVNVTVPAALPVYVINGTVVTADNARITNNAKTGSV